MDTASLINIAITLVSGIVGGNVAGAAMQDKSLGAIGNSISGLVGGGIGGTILKVLGVIGGTTAATAVTGAAATSGVADLGGIGSIIGNVAGSGIGGAILMIIVSLIKNAGVGAKTP